MKTSPLNSPADSFPSVGQSTDVFVYYGVDIEEIGLRISSHPTKRQFLSKSSQKVPKDVVKVLIHPRVKVIPNGTFSKCDRLEEVQFGFADSQNGLDTNDSAARHYHPALCQDSRSDLEVIGESAFSHCVSLKHVALPSSLKWIRKSAFEGCLTLISVEMCYGLARIDDRAFCDCYGLKNVAIPDTVELVGESVVTMRKYAASFDIEEDDDDGMDVGDKEKHPTEDPLVRSLRRRFRDLPLHHLCYFFHQLHPNNHNMDEKFIIRLVEDVSLCDSSKSTTDSFGMTPLHLLACSACPSPILLKVLLDRVYHHGESSNNNTRYSVLTKDSWGNYPIHYAVRCNATIEVVRLLIDAQLKHHNSKDIANNSDKVQPPHLRHRRKEPPHWKGLLELACNLASLPMTKFLIEASVKNRFDALQCPAWRADVRNMIFTYQDKEDEEETPVTTTNALGKLQHQRQPKSLTSPQSRLQLIKAVEKRLHWYKFQESLSLLELAVWKAKLGSATDDSSSTEEDHQQRYRQNCRIHCGADFVTMNVLDFVGSFEDQQSAARKKKKQSIPLLPTPNPWATVKVLRHL